MKPSKDEVSDELVDYSSDSNGNDTLSELGYERLIDTRNYSLEKWLELVFDPPDNALFCDWSFPTDIHHDEYMRTISSRTEEEVLDLIEKFLIPSTSFPCDDRALQALLDASTPNLEKMLKTRYYLRIFRRYLGATNLPPWEGITWVLDVLPYSPKSAIEALNAYLYAHLMFLPDGRIFGLQDAVELIRAKFIGTPDTTVQAIKLLKELTPRAFEVVVERLFNEMGYKTQLTPPSKDGGRDIIAFNETLAKREYLLIECKRYQEPINVKTIRALLGTITSEKATRGLLVTSSRFTRAGRAFAQSNPQLELIAGDELVKLLNEYFGNKWMTRIDRWVQDELLNGRKRERERQKISSSLVK